MYTAAIQIELIYQQVRLLVNIQKIKLVLKKLENKMIYCIFLGSTCVRATYTDLGNKIGVFNEQVNSMQDFNKNIKVYLGYKKYSKTRWQIELTCKIV